MSEFLINHLELDSKFLRSISLGRDLRSPESLDSYLITPAVLTVLRQIGGALRAGSAQRAWKVIGPYGSGKSALGLLLARLLEGKESSRAIYKQLESASLEAAGLFPQEQNRFALAITGSRSSLGDALAQSVIDALEYLPSSRPAKELKRQLDLKSQTYRDLPLNAAAGSLLSDFIAVTRSAGHSGVLLLIDELGKFVEHAALHPEAGDLMSLQQIAETASHPTDDGLLVLTMLHQHFDAYAKGVGRSLSDEWHKVSARFDDVPFDEPVERYAHFAMHALGAAPTITESVGIQQKAREIYQLSVGFKFFRQSAESDLFARAEALYPLHPAALAALAVISKRFGQSERSFHAFMRGHEIGALRDYAGRSPVHPGAWYGLQELFDYLTTGIGLRFRDLEAERRWEYARSVIERSDADLTVLQVELLKAIAVIELVAPSLHIVASPETLGFALMGASGEVEQIASALADLERRTILQSRQASRDYVFAMSQAVNIEALYQETKKRSDDELMFSGISYALAERSVIASRHYQQTGTLRSVRVIAGTPDRVNQAIGNYGQHDGCIGLMFVDSASSDQIASASTVVGAAADILTLTAIVHVGARERSALVEYSRWVMVHGQVKSRFLDPWTERHVETQLAKSREEVSRLVLALLNRQAKDASAMTYWYLGKEIQGSESMNLSQAASWLFDSVFNSAPTINNELINKDKPSSAITAARQRLFELLDKNGSEELLGITDFPPERLLYVSLLQSTRLHRKTGARWSLAAPDKDSDAGVRNVWLELDALLKTDKPVSFAEVISRLAQPPLGVRSGPASIWCVVYLLLNREFCAIFERGSLVLELTSDHMQRMFRSPQTFTFRRFAAVERKALIQDYSTALGAVGVQVALDASYLDVTRGLVRWYMQLPQYSQETLRLSSKTKALRDVIKRATDPVALLAQDIPRVITGGKGKEGVDFVTSLTESLTELGLAFRRLQDEVSLSMAQAFAITGPLKTLRTQLQEECADAARSLADADLKAFIMRCADITLTDDKWLDSIASVVAHRPLDIWTDAQAPQFSNRVQDLCGRYKRWLRVAMSRGDFERQAQRFVGVTLTLPSGEEAAMLLTSDQETKRVADDLLHGLTKQVGGNLDKVASALAQALLQVQQGSNATNEKELTNEQRTAG
ncbi:TPA: hypothetical protein L5V91_003212 [Pseudomonas aeruginosa]|uniref:hypothetical protein n=1 Tax=Pseudomonas aeruginosa TaxID=287 RepID=UPI001AE0B3AE|nr:hypothetical protein [Pseudomonas aeruginosa]ELG5200769.1 hypothetical protein [Pseudomonas aeruginosa]MDI3952781.1 hypothetical protein [Pseudomonas aeruginosa]MDV7962567.1 hypothetical protein [Pseudomonas aeruginosa]HBP1721659.1 hypothetical protein [Pseudomonas aeruginosa]HCE0303694.1 hypothetical protein [Pseudomonas aeruginosa]